MFKRCKKCGAIVEVVKDCTCDKCGIICCGEKMDNITVNSVEASVEKHKPVVTQVENKVNVVVGSVLHPMTKEHLIEMIFVKTNLGVYKRILNENQNPSFTLMLADGERVEKVFAYCNLHGLWE